MRMFASLALHLASVVASAQDAHGRTEGAQVFIISPKMAHCQKPCDVQFGVKGMGIAPAGVKFDDTGHHHLLIDMDAPADLSQPLPATDKFCISARDRRNRADPDAGQAHAAAAVRRSEPYSH